MGCLNLLPATTVSYVACRQGARFTKWRAALRVSDSLPSSAAIEQNAVQLAEYAAISQVHLSCRCIWFPSAVQQCSAALQLRGQPTRVKCPGMHTTQYHCKTYLEHLPLITSFSHCTRGCNTILNHEAIAHQIFCAIFFDESILA